MIGMLIAVMLGSGLLDAAGVVLRRESARRRVSRAPSRPGLSGSPSHPTPEQQDARTARRPTASQPSRAVGHP